MSFISHLRYFFYYRVAHGGAQKFWTSLIVILFIIDVSTGSVKSLFGQSLAGILNLQVFFVEFLKGLIIQWGYFLYSKS